MFNASNPYDLGVCNKGFQYYNNFVNQLTPNCRDLATLYKRFLSLPAPKIVSNLQRSECMINYGLLRKAL